MIIIITLVVFIFFIPSNFIYADTHSVIVCENFGIDLNDWVNSGIDNFILKGNKYQNFVSGYPGNDQYSERLTLYYKESVFSVKFDPEKFGIEWGGLHEIKWANGGVLENMEQYQSITFAKQGNNYSIPKTPGEPFQDKINTESGSFKNQWKDGSLKVDFIPFGISDQNEKEFTDIPLGISVQSEDEHINL